MRTLIAVMVLAACDNDTQTTDTDAGAGYWPCHARGDISPTLSECSPRCANRTLLGRLVWGDGNTCEFRHGEFCAVESMTGPAYDSDTGCCVYSKEPERVDFTSCI